MITFYLLLVMGFLVLGTSAYCMYQACEKQGTAQATAYFIFGFLAFIIGFNCLSQALEILQP